MRGSAGFVLVTVSLGQIVSPDNLRVAFWLHGLLLGAANARVGWGIGSILAGYFWDAHGGTSVFLSAALAALRRGLLFGWVNRAETVAVSSMLLGPVHRQRRGCAAKKCYLPKFSF